MKDLRIRISQIAAAGLLLTCLIFSAAPILAGENNENSKFLLVSFEENLGPFDGTNGSLDGKATFAGAFNDRCTRHEDFHVVSANKDGTQVVITGTSTFFGMNGTLTTSFTGTIHFSADPYISYVEGVESITGGTGIYKDARGKGTFEATQDFAGQPYQVVGVFEVNVKKDK
jgi:hypothetical protein